MSEGRQDHLPTAPSTVEALSHSNNAWLWEFAWGEVATTPSRQGHSNTAKRNDNALEKICYHGDESMVLLMGLQSNRIKGQQQGTAAGNSSKKQQQGTAARNSSREQQQGTAPRNSSKEQQHATAAVIGIRLRQIKYLQRVISSHYPPLRMETCKTSWSSHVDTNILSNKAIPVLKAHTKTQWNKRPDATSRISFDERQGDISRKLMRLKLATVLILKHNGNPWKTIHKHRKNRFKS